jgi:hypothetical protein
MDTYVTVTEHWVSARSFKELSRATVACTVVCMAERTPLLATLTSSVFQEEVQKHTVVTEPLLSVAKALYVYVPAAAGECVAA